MSNEIMKAPNIEGLYWSMVFLIFSLFILMGVFLWIL